MPAPAPPLPPADRADPAAPLVVAAHMGYGHLRAALPLADALGADILEMDEPPLATPHDHETWQRLQRVYDRLSRRASWPILGPLDRKILEWITRIPRLRPPGAQRRANLAVRYLAGLVERGFGRALVERLSAARSPLVATFYAPAIVADGAARHGRGERVPIVSVLTDADVNRVWAPADSEHTSIVFAAPTARAARRLRAFGVPRERVHRTGFPLPADIAAEPAADRARRIAARMRRLDPSGVLASIDAPWAREARGLAASADGGDARTPLHVAFAVGGAGAQVEIAGRLVRSLGGWLRDGRARLTLVAGTRDDAARRLQAIASRAGLPSAPDGPLFVLHTSTFREYAARFHRRLLDVDVLFTKPSEMTFFGAAGFALALTTPLGDQERANRAWAMRLGAALDVGGARSADRWLSARLADGSLARVAHAAATRMPRDGTRRILDLLRAARCG